MKRILTLGWTFFWISSVTLGGGMAMLPVIEREFVERRHWMTGEEMLDVVAVMQSLPGLIVINMAVLVGYRIRGFCGALAAAVGAVVTPFAVIAVIARSVDTLSNVPALDHIFLGVRAGTAALIMMSLLKLAGSALGNSLSRVLCAIAFVAAVIFKVDLTLIVLFGFAVGIALAVASRRRRRES